MKIYLTDEAAVSEAKAKMKASPEELFIALHKRVNNTDIDGQYKDNLIASDFAALLTAISRESSDTAEKNLKIQNRLILLTVIILIITFFSALGPVTQFYQYFKNRSESALHQKELDGKYNNIKQVHIIFST